MKLQCPICTSTRLRPKPFGYSFNGRWLGARKCSNCGIIFIDPQPTPDELRGMYSREYFEGDFRCGHEGSYFDEATIKRLGDEGLLHRIKSFKHSGAFLEVGCAGGAFLDAARREGFDAHGVEYSEDAAQFARTQFGLDVITGDLADAGYASDSFDVVFMGDVLEHLPKPLGTLEEINRILRVGGLLVILCPMQTNTLFSRTGFAVYGLLGARATVHLPPYHLYEFRPRSLRYLIERAGLRVMRLNESILPPGSITLRGGRLQKIGKKLFHYPNYVMNSLAGIMGDRVEVYATKVATP